METVLIKNVSLAAKRQPSELISILVIDGKFADTFSSDKNFAGATTLDFEGLQILPGFIDVHNHGAVGVDVNEADADGLLEIGRFLARHGVTAWMPTLVPDSDENYRRVISEIDRLMLLQKDQNVAQAVGVHYEGVFANEKMCGALRPEYFKSFTGTQVDELPHLRHGVHMTTFAPEVEGGVPLAYRLVQEGWVASIGHTRADIETLDNDLGTVKAAEAPRDSAVDMLVIERGGGPAGTAYDAELAHVVSPRGPALTGPPAGGLNPDANLRPRSDEATHCRSDFRSIFTVGQALNASKIVERLTSTKLRGKPSRWNRKPPQQSSSSARRRSASMQRRRSQTFSPTRRPTRMFNARRSPNSMAWRSSSLMPV